MTDMQAKLDKSAKTLMRLIRQAERAASDACAAGDEVAAERLHKIAAHMRMAYAEGRGLRIQTPDGAVRPAFGDK